VNRYKVAVIETDGIGREVVPAGLRVLEAAGLRHDIVLEDRPEGCRRMAWTSYAASMSSTLALSFIPGVPDHISPWGLLIPMRRAFQPYVNLRPVHLLPGIDSPLKNFPPGQIDMCIVRENIANPLAQIWSGAMMLQHLGQPKAAKGVEQAFEAALARRDAQTPDLGGKASTRDVGDAVPQEISVVAEP